MPILERAYGGENETSWREKLYSHFQSTARSYFAKHCMVKGKSAYEFAAERYKKKLELHEKIPVSLCV